MLPINDLITELTALTDGNQHTEAALLVASFAMHGRAVRYCRAVAQGHKTIGDLPPQLLELRNTALEWSLQFIQRDHGAAVADRIRSTL